MFGRAARAANRKGMAVLIGDDWAIGDRSGDSQIRHAIADGRSLLNREQDVCSVASDNEHSNNILPSSSSPMMSDVIPPSSPPVNVDTLVSKMTRRNKNARKTNIERRDGLPEPVWDFMNEENRCLRLIFLRWFQDQTLPLPSDYPKSWCCSICNPALDVTGLELDVRCGSEVMNLDGHDSEFETKLRKWLQSWIYDNVKDYDIYPPPEHLLSKQQIAQVSCQSFPMEPQAIHTYLMAAVGFEDLGQDVWTLIEFIIHQKGQISLSIPLPKRNAQVSRLKSQGGSDRLRKRKALAELDANTTPSGKRAKRGRI